MINDIAKALTNSAENLANRINLFEQGRFLSLPRSASKGGSSDLSRNVAESMVTVPPSKPPMADSAEILQMTEAEIGFSAVTFPDRITNSNPTAVTIASGSIRNDSDLKRIV